MKLIALLLATACTSTLTSESAQELVGSGWERHTVFTGLRGADGVDIAPDGSIVSAWEESGAVTVSTRPADPTNAWPTTVYTGMLGAEDAKFGDLNHTGGLDVAVATDAGQRLYVILDGVVTVLPTSTGHNHWMQVAVADVDHDGWADVIAGSRIGTAANPAVVAWFQNPGTSGGAWVYHQISLAGWVMSLQVQPDGRLLVTDRASYRDSANAVKWDLYGARLETPGPDPTLPWTTEQISVPGGCAGCTPGDEMFGGILADGSLLHCQSSLNKVNRVVRQHRLAVGWSAPTLLPAPTVAEAGYCQGPVEGDLDLDGLPDVVVSTWEANALPASAKVGVYAILGTGAILNISGAAGTKYDNAVIWDVDGDGWPDVVDSEQVENQGVIWYRNPGPSL